MIRAGLARPGLHQLYRPPPLPGPAPGAAAGLIRARQVIIVGTGGELLVYSPTEASGNLIASIAAALTTDGALNDAVKQGVWSYQAPGVGQAAGLEGGAVVLAAGPTSGAGPWTEHFNALFTGTGVQLNCLQNGDTLALSSGPPAGGGAAGGAGTTIDGEITGGREGFYPSGGTTDYTNTTLTTDPNLQVTGLFASGIYKFLCNIIYDGFNGAAGGLKWNVATDGTGHCSMTYEGSTGAQVTNADAFPLSGHSAATVGIGSLLHVSFDGILYLPVSTTGSVAMQLAQASASATRTRVYDGSYLKLKKIG